MRAVVCAFMLATSGAANAETLHYALSGGTGLANGGLGGFKLEIRFGPVAAFGAVGIGPVPAAGIRYYFASSQSGAGFASLDYAHYSDGYHDPICCEFYEYTYDTFGAVLGYRFRFAPGFLDLGMGPAWTLRHHKENPPFGAPIDTREVRFGWFLDHPAPDFTLALGLEF